MITLVSPYFARTALRCTGHPAPAAARETTRTALRCTGHSAPAAAPRTARYHPDHDG
jgi:hypothetical protein